MREVTVSKPFEVWYVFSAEKVKSSFFTHVTDNNYISRYVAL